MGRKGFLGPRQKTGMRLARGVRPMTADRGVHFDGWMAG